MVLAENKMHNKAKPTYDRQVNTLGSQTINLSIGQTDFRPKRQPIVRLDPNIQILIS